MTDRQTHDGDWVAAWISRQRDMLARGAQAQAGDTEAAEFGERWVEAGKAFLDGMRRFAGVAAPGAAPTLDPFDIGNTMAAVWTQATMFQSHLAEQAADFLQRLPPVGLAREQTEAWRELAAAHAECKRLEHEVRSVLAKVQLDALDLLEQRVRERTQPLESFRELYDLWVDCGERVYGELAHSHAYSKLQAELGNATMRLRIRVQTVLEQALKQFDLPTRSELNSLHRQVRELTREVERLRSAPARRPAAPRKQAERSRKAKARSR